MSDATSRRRFCRRCGFPIRQGKTTCPSCNSDNTATAGQFIVPQLSARTPELYPPHPWKGLVWPEGATISLASKQGLGKSSIAMALQQTEGMKIGAWITTEQDPYQVHRIAERIRVPVPPIWSVTQTNALESALRGVDAITSGAGSVIVFDSLTPLGLVAAVQMMNRLIADAREHGWRVLMINQTNKADQIAGSAQLAFLPDIDVRLTQDKFARRRLYVGKNRYGNEFTRYFQVARDGTITQPNFEEIVHSVEGLHPNLELVPYGLADGSVPGKPGQARGKKVQWASVLDPLAEYGLLPRFAGYAAAGAESAGTSDGLMYPPDWEARRDFAEAHGLKWLSREEIAASLAPTGWQTLAIRLIKRRQKIDAEDGDTSVQLVPVKPGSPEVTEV